MGAFKCCIDFRRKKKDLISFFETLENDDDVKNIYSNVKFPN